MKAFFGILKIFFRNKKREIKFWWKNDTNSSLIIKIPLYVSIGLFLVLLPFAIIGLIPYIFYLLTSWDFLAWVSVEYSSTPILFDNMTFQSCFGTLVVAGLYMILCIMSIIVFIYIVLLVLCLILWIAYQLFYIFPLWICDNIRQAVYEYKETYKNNIKAGK